MTFSRNRVEPSPLPRSRAATTATAGRPSGLQLLMNNFTGARMDVRALPSVPAPTARARSRTSKKSKSGSRASASVLKRPENYVHWDKWVCVLHPDDPRGVLITTGHPQGRIVNGVVKSLAQLRSDGIYVERERNYLDDVVFFRPRHIVIDESTNGDLFTINVHPDHTLVFDQEVHAKSHSLPKNEPSILLRDYINTLPKIDVKTQYISCSADMQCSAFNYPFLPMHLKNTSLINNHRLYEVRVRVPEIPRSWLHASSTQ